jgi:hypothetical protein
MMNAWRQIDVDVLPAFDDRKRYTMYRTPDGHVWVPNNLHVDGNPTHWEKLEDHFDRLEKSLDADLSR